MPSSLTVQLGCDARDQIAVRRLADEPFVEVEVHVEARDVFGAMRVERLQLGAVADVQHLLLRELRAARAADLRLRPAGRARCRAAAAARDGAAAASIAKTP